MLTLIFLSYLIHILNRPINVGATSPHTFMGGVGGGESAFLLKDNIFDVFLRYF